MMSPPDEEMVPPAATAPEPTPPTAPPGRAELEDALRFINRDLLEQRLSQLDVAATLKALVETLVHAGALPPHEYERRRARALDAATQALRARPPVKLGEAVDKYALAGLPEIDCASLLPLCKARCCTLTVFCSAQDLDERLVQWDYARPYRLRKREDGYCAHSEPGTHRCDIYARRPATCRTYDCRNDRRIWRDFARRIPTQA